MGKKKKGIYIVFEGIVGSGKTTQSKLLVERLKKEFPRREIVWTREPGGSEIAGAIRRIVQATEYEETMEPVSECYLYAAARAQMLRKVVIPVIKRGGIIISDRSFVTSIAYQGAGRGLDYKTVLKINETAIDGTRPDILFFVDMDPAVSLKRTRDAVGDKWERMGLAFFQQAKKGYDYAEKKLGKIWVNIDGNGTVEEVHEKIYKNVLKLLKKN